jgi:hypothetical protein
MNLGLILHTVQTGSGAYSVSYPKGTSSSFPSGKADYSPPSSGKVKNTSIYKSTPTYIFMAWYLIKHVTPSHLSYGGKDSFCEFLGFDTM